MKHLHVVSLIALTTTLAACGSDGGGGVASTPPPPPPASAPAPSLVSTAVETVVIPAPATRPGTYDTIALVEHDQSGNPSTYRLATPSDVRITTYQPGQSPNDVAYTIQFATPDLPGGLSSLTTVVEGRSVDVSPNGAFGSYRDATRGQYPVRFGQELTATNNYSDGSQKVIFTERYSTAAPDQTSISVDGRILDHMLTYDTGLSYVSLGSWNWATYNPQEQGGNFIEGGIVRFVHGDRTPAAAIPVSGSASYTATTRAFIDPSWASNVGGVLEHEALQFALTADFGQRSISAQINQDFKSGSSGDAVGGYETYVAPGLDLHGTGSITSLGSFDIPLGGTMTTLVQGAQSTFSVAGALDGAFFGPHAEQVGGVFAVGQVPGNALLSDAFVGTRN